MSEAFRIEKDSLGEVRVPANALYGAQTQRAVMNFPVSGMRPYPAFVWAQAMIKRAAAEVNRDLGLFNDVTIGDRTISGRQIADAARAEANARLAEERAAELERQTVRLQETEHTLRTLIATLETPTVPLASGVLLAPIVGRVDSRRAEALVHRLLTVASAERTRLMIIDIAGVPTFDTQVAQSLLHAAQALELIGCRVALTGISPTTAQTITALGIRMDNIMIARSPQDILAQR